MHKFLSIVDFAKNESRGFKLENVLALPSLVSGDQGSLRYHSGLKKFYGWNGTDWIDLASGAGAGDVTKVGTPADNQIAVWTGDGTVEGTSNFTWNEVTRDLLIIDNTNSRYVTIDADLTEIGFSSTIIPNRSYYGINGFKARNQVAANYTNVVFANTNAEHTVTIPNATGTIALDENLLHTTGDETSTGIKTFERIKLDKSLEFLPDNIFTSSGRSTIGLDTSNRFYFTQFQTTQSGRLDFNSLTSTQFYTFPDKTGTIALLDDAGTSGSYVPTFSSLVNLGTPTSVYANYTQVGNIVTGSISASFTVTSANTNSSFSFTLPVARATSNSINISTGMAYQAVPPPLPGFGQSNSTTTSSFIFRSVSTNQALVAIKFQYSILD